MRPGRRGDRREQLSQRTFRKPVYNASVRRKYLPLLVILFAGLTYGQSDLPTSPPVLVQAPQNEVPDAARQARIGGKVLLRLAVDETGAVTSAKVIRGPDWVCPQVTTPAVTALRDEAVASGMQARFLPALKNGKAVRGEADITIVFPVAPKPQRPGSDPLRIHDLDEDDPIFLHQVKGKVVKGRAKKLAVPIMPSVSQLPGARETVVVDVLIIEDGSIYAATPLVGRPEFNKAAYDAACASRFSPTTLDGRPVKVTGRIHYTFGGTWVPSWQPIGRPSP